MQRHTFPKKAAAATAVVLAVVLGLAGVASAHVTVTPSSAEQGSFTVLTFRVPNEKDDASTVGLTITMPPGEPLAFASVKPVPGWTSTTTKAAPSSKVEVEGISVDEVVTSVTWSGGEVKPGEFQEFSISVGPLPDADQLVFAAEQTYSDGSVVDWNEPMPASGEEPDHPAPTVTLTPAAEGSDHHGGEESADSGDEAATPISADVATHEDVDTATSRATIGIVLGALGLVLGLIALFVALRRAKPAPPAG
jgi:uncharacterized protein YcnI